MWNGIFACLVCFLGTLIFVPPVGKLAWRIGAIDVPRDFRRMHQRSVPRCGGIAIFLSFLGGCLLFVDLDAFLSRTLMGAALLFLIGLLDDIRSVSPWLKFSVQILAAVIGCGKISGIATIGAILWVVSLTNAHNFIDGIDGLFAGCAAIEGIALGWMLFLTGYVNYILPSLLLCVICLAFRVYNRHPASIFVGDCGSGTVGYLLGMLSLSLFYEANWHFGWLAPLFLFAYPLVDLFTAVVRRILRGQSPFTADRGHLHHRICAIGVGQVICGRVLMFLSAMLSLIGICLCREEYLLLASLACLIGAGFLVEIRAFFLLCSQ